LFKSLKVKDHP